MEKIRFEEESCKALGSRYLQLLLSQQSDTAISEIMAAVDDWLPLKTLYLKVLQPVQHELGRLWQNGSITVAEEHFCTAATQQVISRLYPRIFSTPKNGRILVAAFASGELHEVGLRMVADFFELNGWSTHFFSASAEPSEVISAVTYLKADLIAISATMERHVEKVAGLVNAIHSAHSLQRPRILVGGHPFNLNSSLWLAVGADGTAREAEQAVQEGNRLCSPQ